MDQNPQGDNNTMGPQTEAQPGPIVSQPETPAQPTAEQPVAEQPAAVQLETLH